jgi:hypothetical protein
MNVVLISCVGKKKSRKFKAKDLYDSTWFRYAWRYAQSLNPDKIFILSAKYGLVDPETEIQPYEETLNSKSDNDIRVWAIAVLNALREKTDLPNDMFTILAGEKYRRHLVGYLPNYNVPMDGMRIGQQLSWLRQRCP